MKVLVFGDSSSVGKDMTNPGRRWPVLVGEAFRERRGDELEVIEAPFFATSATAASYAERKLAATDPDIVIIIVGTYGVIMRSVAVRVENLFGKRASKLAGAVERRLERKDGRGVVAKLRARSLRAARWTAHHTIGAASISHADAMFANYKATFALLARRENTQILCIRWNSTASRQNQAINNLPLTQFDRLYDGHPDLVKVRDALQERINAEIEARHFASVTFAEYKQRTGNVSLPENGDAVRINDNGHEVFAEMVFEKLVEMIALAENAATARVAIAP